MTTDTPLTHPVRTYLLTLQDTLCQALTAADGSAAFHEAHWDYPHGGGGRTRIIENGAVFEKGGVNFSHVKGVALPPSATAKRPDLKGQRFQALGVSVVMHPDNPYVPTSHANVRFLIAEEPSDNPLWWFGGGYDLTPCYGFAEDCQHWHQTAKQACDPFGETLYARYKQACDAYFFLPHRNEPRGIGGLFFDDLNAWPFDRCFAFMRSVGDSYLPAYLPIVQQRQPIAFGERQKRFQAYRRGRYVEFNLVHDRGTLFGLQSGGRTESILMSLPPTVRWDYNWQPAAHSEEAQLYADFLITKDWL